ncbi:MAG: thiolase family protein [Chloroflexota bacterium]|nr:thiolase family protein [Chloroflexota bacterium]MDE3193107.1 thiolase family protein [Chloroflexota bacterium]
MTTPKYAIVGLGMVYGPYPEGVTARGAEAEAGRLAIADAGLRREDVDGALQLRRTAGGGERPAWADAFPRMLGLPFKFFFTVGRGGALAGLGIATAMGFLELGIAKYVLIVGGVEDFKNSRRTKAEGHRGMVHSEKAGYWGKPFGDLRAPSHHSFLAARHMYEYGTTSRQLGSIAVQERAWACKNPKAKMYGRPMTIEDHQNSPFVVEPYHLFDICLVSDGAVAFILTTAERAKDTAKKPIWVRGLGSGEIADSLWWEKKNYTHMAVKTAKEQAFGQAGIDLGDVDVAELYDCFTAEVLFQIEDYGWCKKGEGGPFVAEGHIGPGGDVPVNTSGGLLSAYHYGDLTCLSEAVMQLRGDAGERQVKGAEIALVTGHGGELISPGMCSIHTSLVLGV